MRSYAKAYWGLEAIFLLGFKWCIKQIPFEDLLTLYYLLKYKQIYTLTTPIVSSLMLFAAVLQFWSNHFLLYADLKVA